MGDTNHLESTERFSFRVGERSKKVQIMVVFYE